MKHQEITVIDFGGQHCQLVARRIRDLNVYCQVIPYKKALDHIKENNPLGLILIGQADKELNGKHKLLIEELAKTKLPILAINYAIEELIKNNGGEIKASQNLTNELIEIENTADHNLLAEIKSPSKVWTSYFIKASDLGPDFKIIQERKNGDFVTAINEEKSLYLVQYHPELSASENGTRLIKNFLYNICKCQGDWTVKNFKEDQIQKIRDKVGDKKVLLALSGGVDSSVCAALISKAIGKNLTCVFVDTGLMRKNEGNEVEGFFKGQDLNFIRLDAEERFLGKLKGVTDPEKKRKIIGEEFIRVFEEVGRQVGSVDYLAQGTIYPDIIESGKEDDQVIKSHHNVGGLPDVIDFKDLVEPLKDLFKDEVRRLGEELQMPDFLVHRQPFPGPGLAVRVMGEITKERLDILREADYIFREEIALAGLDREISQYFAIITNIQTVGVKNDQRTYDYTLALRAVKTNDFMVADWVKIPFEVLEKVSSRITSEVNHINRVVYDITSKPPATIEWE